MQVQPNASWWLISCFFFIWFNNHGNSCGPGAKAEVRYGINKMQQWQINHHVTLLYKDFATSHRLFFLNHHHHAKIPHPADTRIIVDAQCDNV